MAPVPPHFVLTLFAALCVFSGALPAVAAGWHEEIFIRKGVELRRKGRNQEALAEFQKAFFEVAHTPRAAAQLGLCEQSLGNWLRAHLHLSDALTSG